MVEENEKIHKAFIKVIINAYTDNENYVNQHLEDFMNREDNVVDYLKQFIQPTKNYADNVTVRDFNDFIEEHISRISKSVIKMTLPSLHIKEKKSGSTRYYSGLKLIIPVE